MHQRCALQSVVGTLILQVMVGQTAQFVIDQGQERLQVVAVATPPTLQELCDLTRRLVRQQIRPQRVGITGCVAYRFPFRLSNTEKHRKTGGLRVPHSQKRFLFR